MKIKTVQLTGFKRFTHLTIDLGDKPKKIIALVGPNGCGKSSVFDAFEEKAKDKRGGARDEAFTSKGLYSDQSKTEAVPDAQIKITTDAGDGFERNNFYFRSSYRFTANLNLTQSKKLPDILQDEKRPNTSAHLDSRLHENYERLYGSFHDEVFDKPITGEQWVNQKIFSLNEILNEVLDIKISHLGNHTEGRGTLYFEKGSSKDFPYKNLSSGEKEVIDLILDLVIKVKTYNDTVFCIDEPELHINTAIQRKLLVEIEKLIPDNCQLWIATHSIGFLRALQEELKDKTQIIDMSGHDFDSVIELEPIDMTRSNWKKIFQTALEDLTGLIAPKQIIYCEGKTESDINGLEQGLDAQIYNIIFEKEFPDVLFVSSGGNNEPRKYSEIALSILNKAFTGVEIFILKDRGGEKAIKTDDKRRAYLTVNKNNRMLNRREIENYVFDPEVLLKFKSDINIKNIYADEIDFKTKYLKSKHQIIKQKLGFDKSISIDEIKIELAKTIECGMNVYSELKKDIFGAT